MRHLILALPLFLLSACTTVEFVRKDISPKKQAIVRFAPPATPTQETKYRDKVAEEAQNYCGGNFEIIKEYQARDDTGRSSGLNTGVGFGSGGFMIGGSTRDMAMYNFVEFSCK